MSKHHSVEALENRRLMSASGLSDHLSLTKTGTLLVQGTGHADRIAINRRASVVAISFDGGKSYVASTKYARVKRVVVEGGAGDDTLTLTGSYGRPATLVGGAGNDQLIDDTRGADSKPLTITGPAASPGAAVQPPAITGYQFETEALVDRPFVFSGGNGDDRATLNHLLQRVDGGAGTDYVAAYKFTRDSTPLFSTESAGDSVSFDVLNVKLLASETIVRYVNGGKTTIQADGDVFFTAP